MKYAVIKAGGSQFKISEGDEIEIGKIEGRKGGPVDFKEILLLVDKEKVKIGQPFLKDVKVKGRILEQKKGPKIRVATYKAKSRYRKVKGHRSLITRIKIEKIV